MLESCLFRIDENNERNNNRDRIDDSLHVSVKKKTQLQCVDVHVLSVYRCITNVNGIMSYMANNRKKGRGLTVDRHNVVVSQALMERHIIYTPKSTVNIIEGENIAPHDSGVDPPSSVLYGLSYNKTQSEISDLATVYYRSSTIKQEKGN